MLFYDFILLENSEDMSYLFTGSVRQFCYLPKNVACFLRNLFFNFDVVFLDLLQNSVDLTYKIFRERHHSSD